MTATLLACCLMIVAADAEPEGTEPVVEEGFISLFNGKDLSDWKAVQGRAEAFRVEDGQIIGNRKTTPAGAYWLSTDRKYGDFVLRLDCMLEQGGNSGVFIRVPNYIGRTSRVGMEIQIQDDGHLKGKPNKGHTGAIYQVVAPTEFITRPPGEWNEIEIACQGDDIRVVMNGKVVNEANMSEHEALKDRPREGFIGISAHTNDVRFRNIRIRELAPGDSIEAAQAAGSTDAAKKE